MEVQILSSAAKQARENQPAGGDPTTLLNRFAEGLAPSDLPLPIGPLTPAHDLCGYPSGLEGLGACAPAQSRYSLRDGIDVRLRGGIRRAHGAGRLSGEVEVARVSK